MNNYFLQKALQGRLYHAHNTTAGAVTAIHATCTGLILENPQGSGKDLIVESASFVGSTLTTISELGIAVSPTISVAGSSSTTAMKSFNARLSGDTKNEGAALVFSVATLPFTPVWFEALASARDTGAVEGGAAFYKAFDGTLIVAPGFQISFAALTTARTGLCSITWAEEDVLTEQDIAQL